jgi:uncharacterized peroxidase-related enzyme
MHHGRNLRQLTKNDSLVAQLNEDYTQADLAPADKVMLAYVAKLTRTPSAIKREDMDALRKVGFTDRAILDIAQITAYYAYVNRLVDGLGVTLEAYWAQGKQDYE